MNDNDLLVEVAASAYGRHDGDLLYFLMAYRNRADLPSYQPLLNRVREVLLTRHTAEYVESVLKFALPAELAVTTRNTGHPVYKANQL